MTNSRIVALQNILLLILIATPWAIYAESTLPVRVNTLLRAAALADDHIAVSVIRLRDGVEVMQHRPTVPMQPASTLKVLTSIVALETLGPTYRGATELRTGATQTAATLTGDIVLRGMASPDFDWVVLRNMLQKLRDDGVKEIVGDLVLDRSLFNPTRYDVGVPPFDETPEFRYNVIPDALLLNMNLLQFDIETDSVGFRVRTTPVLDGVVVASNMRFADRKCADWEDGWKLPTVMNATDGEIRIYLEGDFPRNCKISTNLSLIDRNELTWRMVTSLWRELGGNWKGKLREASLGETGRVLATHQSRSLGEFVRDINKKSDNTITRLALLTLGTNVVPGNENISGDTITKGEAVIRAWLKKNLIPDEGLILDNGSGLSRTARITATQLARTLQAAAKSIWAPELTASLPIVAIDGGMRSRLNDSPAARTARIKTGGLRNVAAIAGYVPDAKGDMHAVVAMINNDTVKGSVMRPILDALIDGVARSGAK